MAKEKRVARGFSFSPEIIGNGPDGEHMVEDAAHYTLMITHSNGRLAYIAKENKYYLGEGSDIKAECPSDRLKQLMRYIRWNYDELVDEVIPIEGNKVGKKTGFKISKSPPTIENIATKRRELMDAVSASGEYLDEKTVKDILSKTSPTQMLENEAFQAYLDEVPQDARLARRLAGQAGF